MTSQHLSMYPLNDRPIIAVLAQETPSASNDGNKSYIAASYVKDIESAGARVVPIPITYDRSLVEELFRCVNGLLLPGGGAKLQESQYFQNAKIFFELAIEANKNGNFFPIWGTCLGFEAIPIIVAGTRDVLTANKALDKAIPIKFTEEASSCRLYRDLSPTLLKALESENITYHWHKYGFYPEIFGKNEKLSDMFKVLSTSVDDESEEPFVSSYEAREYPIYGVMWHPEKNNYEFKTARQTRIPHSSNAIQVTQYLSRFFVDEARKSKHRFPSAEMEEKYLIYQHSPVQPDETLGFLSLSFQQIYIFS